MTAVSQTARTLEIAPLPTADREGAIPGALADFIELAILAEDTERMSYE
jgi:hypothetical protein